tara:strand:- start:172 stop:1338 length:1167 start_codon:yes stop_codon:yes gene_type:complete
MDFKIVKKIVFGLLMTIGILNAQNNLVFNKALNFRLVPGNSVTPGQTATVPDGKVWKIESYQRDGAGSIYVAFEIQNPEYGSTISYGSYSTTPIWLQEGTVLKAPSDGIYFSVLEFNVVPTSTGIGSGSGGGTGTSVGTGSGGGQSYGDDFTEGSQLTDNDGNVYETVQIGDQIWTTSNLNVSSYSDGTPIPYISNKLEWINSSTGAYTYYMQDDQSGYGKIYNYHAIVGNNDNNPNTPPKKLAPEGYHIPNVYEWDNLFELYGGIESAGTYLKSETSWYIPGNNQSGLNIKKFGFVGVACFETGSCLFRWGIEAQGSQLSYTQLATTNIEASSGIKFKTVIFSDNINFAFYGQNIGSTAPAYVRYGYLESWSYQDRQGGVYVRLIKD